MNFPDTFPGADQRYRKRLKVVGSFQGGAPLGVTVHYTADRDLDRTIRALAAKELGYHLLIDRDGGIYQAADLNQQVWHAGKAVWRNINPNRSHVAVSIVSWGEVQEEAGVFSVTWNGVQIPDSDVARRKAPVTGVETLWDAATQAQEIALSETLEWLVDQGVAPANVCGHDEAALPHGRKCDPGGVLSRTMEQIRTELVAHALKNPLA